MIRILHVTDTHIGPTPDYELYSYNTYQQTQRFVDYVNHHMAFQPDLILHTGDVCYNPDSLSAKLAYEVLSQLKYPLYVARGNHDDPQALCDYFPNLPHENKHRIDYDFIHDDYHFIVLDSFGHVQPAGEIEPEQLIWLQKKLEQSNSASIVIVVHHLPVWTGNGWLDARMRIINGDELFDVLQPYQSRIRVLLFGHIHVPSTHWYRGILCSSAPAVFSQFIFPDDPQERFTVTSPGGFSFVTITTNQVSILHHQLGDILDGD